MNLKLRKRKRKQQKQKKVKQETSAKAVLKRNANDSRSQRVSGIKRRADLGTPNTITALNTKTDLGKGRTLYATTNKKGKAEYLPKKSDASDREINLGLFIKDSAIEALQPDSIGKKLTGDKPRFDLTKGRKVYPIEFTNDKGETDVAYFPRKSDASDAEINSGSFVNDSLINANAANGTPNTMTKQKPRFDLTKNRKVYATETTNEKGKKKTEYLPRESDATPFERNNGLFVKDSAADELEDSRAIAKEFKGDTNNPEYQKLRAERAARRAGFEQTGEQSRQDIGRGRKVYPAEVVPGVTKYLPKESDATAAELRTGYFVKDGEQITTDATDTEGRRDVSKIPFPIADDGTELWDGSTLPELNAATQNDVLKKQKARYDIRRGRMLYPTETGPGKVEYLPLEADATTTEINNGALIVLVPDISLTQFLRERAPAREFETDGKTLKAYAATDVEKAFVENDAFVLRSQQYQKSITESEPALQQEWHQ